MPPIHAFATWRVKPGKLAEVLSLLPAVVRASAAEPGNLFYQVHQHTTEPNTLILFEGYRDEAALAAHRDAAHFQTIVVAQIVPLLDGREVALTTPLTL